MFVDRARAARELVRICKPDGYVVDVEAYFVGGTPAKFLESRQALFPGLVLEDPEGWADLYRSAGLTDIEYVRGPGERSSVPPP